MAEPALQLPEDDHPEIQPDIRPDLRALEGGGESTPPKTGHLAAVKDGADTKEALASSEAAAAGRHRADKDERANLLQRTKRTLWGTKARRRSTVGGGITALIISLIGGGSLWFSGPFELIHIAQFMQKAHFSQQEDAGDDRLGKMYRFMRSGGNPGETRIGNLQAKYKTQMLDDLEKIGLKPDYGTRNIYQGFEIDTTNPDSPYYKMNEDSVKAKLAERGVTGGISSENGKITVSTKSFFGTKERASMRLMVKDLGYTGISTSLRVRILSKYGLADWHPLKRLAIKGEANTIDAFKKWLSDRETKYKTGVDPATVNADNAHTEDTDKNGDTKSTPASDADKAEASSAPGDTEKSSGILKDLGAGKSAASIAGGVAAVQGIVCSLKGIADNIGEIRYEQVALPMIRMGLDAVTEGNQAMSGQDIDQTLAGFVSKSYTGKDPQTGKTTTWDQAASIEAESGKPNTGIAAPEEVQGLNKGIPSWLQWTQSGTIGGFCSKSAQLVGGAVSVTLGVLSGGIVSTASGLISGALVAPKVIAAASNYLAGDAVNVAAAGAEWGNYINYGSRLGSNTMAMQFGGTELTSKEELSLKQQTNANDRADFASKSFAYRMFNLDDSRTVASALLDKSAGLQPSSIASTFGSFLTGFGSVLKTPLNLFSSSVHADTSYDYGFAKYGFSQSDLDNPLVEDPFANADAAAQLLDGPNGQSYIDKASKCFGVNLVKGTEEGWDVTPGQDVNVFAGDYDASSCRDAGNNDWLRIRFFIFDTATMEGWACYHNDEVSCQNDGVTAQQNDAVSGSGGKYTVATYNIRVPGQSGGSNNGTAPVDQRAKRAAQLLEDQAVDIIGFQEIADPTRAALNDALTNYDKFPHGKSDGPDKSWLTPIYWKSDRFKKIDQGYVGNIWRDCSHQTTVFCDKNPWVELQDKDTGQQLYVLSTHLLNQPIGVEFGGGPQREASAKAIIDWADSKQSANAAVILLGDFNSDYRPAADDVDINKNPDRLPYCLFSKAGYVDSYDAANSNKGYCPSKNASFQTLPYRIDHVYVSKGFSAYVTSDKRINNEDTHFISDHNPTLATINIPGSDDSASTGKDFVGNDGFGGGSCVDYVKYILSRHSSKYHGGSLGDGKDVANTLGSQYGYTVNHTPAIHATVSFPTNFADPPYGHVALVAQINKDGSIVVEESNWTNVNRYGTHTVPANIVPHLTYAHTEVGWH
jgi:surface antigen/endonuclease/exonuclease/phosphatase family metal-dependent hydrolase